MQPLPRRLGARRGERRGRGASSSSSAIAARGACGSRSTPPAATDGLVDPTLGRRAARRRLRPDVRPRPRARRLDIRAGRPPARAWREIELDDATGCCGCPPGSSSTSARPRRRSPPTAPPARIAAETGSGALVSLGGDIAVAGRAARGGWCVLIADDHARRSTRRARAVVITAGGLATSSTAVRRWRTDRGRGAPPPRPADRPAGRDALADGLRRRPSCVDANVAATAALVLGDARA